MAARKLKVFKAQFGFYDSVVAAPSQAAALRAWGAHQNLFAGGEATLVTDEGTIAAALAHPETPLRRAVGTTDRFELEPSSLPKLPDAPRAPAAKGSEAKPFKAEPSKAKVRPAADRSKLNAAEDALRVLDEDRKREEAELHREEADLEARRSKAQQAYTDARKAATESIGAERETFRKAGGVD